MHYRLYLLLLILFPFGRAAFAQSVQLPDRPIDYNLSGDSLQYFANYKGPIEGLSYNQINWYVAGLKKKAELNAQNKEELFAYLQKAEDIAKSVGANKLLAPIYIQRASQFSRYGEFARAVMDFHMGIRYHQLYGSEDRIAGYPFIELGNMYYKLKQYKRAEGIYRRALDHFEHYQEDTPMWGQAVALNNIALCKNGLGQADSALLYFKEAYALRLKISNPVALLHSMLYLTGQYNTLNQTQKADSLVHYMELFTDTIKNMEDQPFFKEIQLEKARVELELGQANAALKSVKQVYYGQPTVPQLKFNLHALKLESEIQFERGQFRVAEALIDSALNTLVEIGDFPFILECLQLKAKILGSKNDVVGLKVLTNEIIATQAAIQKQENDVVGQLFDLNLELSSERIKSTNLQLENKEVAETSQSRLLFLLAAIAVLLLVMALSLIIYRQNKKAKKSKLELQHVHQQLRDLIDSIENQIISTDAEGEILFVNSSCQRFYQKILDRHLLPGQNIFQVLRKTEHLESWRELLTKAKGQKKAWNDQVSAGQGEKEYYLRNVHPIYDGDILLAVIIVMTDTTKSKKQEEALANKKAELDAVNKGKQQLINLLAHDLKDVIYSSHTMTEMIINEPEAYSREEMLNIYHMMHSSLGKNKNLLENILAWARTQSQGLHLSPKYFNLQELCSEILHSLQNRIDEKQIRVELDMPDEIEVYTDADLLRAVLRNLISNAIKFVSPEQGIITIGAKRESGHYAIFVEDNGPGMTALQVEEIQKSLFTKSAKGTMGERGSGFGLSICREYLKVMKSDLKISTELGEGSCFYFHLPLKRTDDTMAKV